MYLVNHFYCDENGKQDNTFNNSKPATNIEKDRETHLPYIFNVLGTILKMCWTQY